MGNLKSVLAIIAVGRGGCIIRGRFNRKKAFTSSGNWLLGWSISLSFGVQGVVLRTFGCACVPAAHRSAQALV